MFILIFAFKFFLILLHIFLKNYFFFFLASYLTQEVGRKNMVNGISTFHPWLNMDIYPHTIELQPHYGRTTINKNTITTIGSGAGIGSTTDNFQFAFQQIINDGSIIAKVTNISDSPSSRSGIMIRETLYENGANVYLSYSPIDGVLLSSRDVTGGVTMEIARNKDVTTLPLLLQLERNNDNIMATISSNGQDWITVGAIRIQNMAHDNYFGTAVSSQNKTTIVTTVFEDVEVKSL
jgi:hypothetical protein